MPSADPELRASDAERERTVVQLRQHCSAGRLSTEELEERCEAAYSARTVAELRALLLDLPRTTAAPPRPGHDAAREAAKRRVLQGAGYWAVLSVAMTLVWVAAGAGFFWPVWIIGGAGIRLVVYAWSQLGPGAEQAPRSRRQR